MEESKLLEAELGKNQTMIAKSIQGSLIMSGIFHRVGVAKKDDKYYIAAIPRFIFADMIDDKNKPEDIIYVIELPGEITISTLKDLQSQTISMGQALMRKYLMGNRDLIFDNAKGEEDEKNE